MCSTPAHLAFAREESANNLRQPLRRPPCERHRARRAAPVVESGLAEVPLEQGLLVDRVEDEWHSEQEYEQQDESGKRRFMRGRE